MKIDQAGRQEIETVTRLLEAHVALIRETSDALISNLFRDIGHLQKDIDALVDGQPEQEKIKARVYELYGHLQVEDMLRQQTFVIEAGLRKLSKTQIPPDSSPDAWMNAALAEVKANYVMKSQHDLHAEVFGEDRDEAQDGGTSLLF